MKIKLTKKEAALRQLNVAVKMYFHGEDSVAIHTLSMAAYNVFDDLYSMSNGEKWSKEFANMTVKDGYQKYFIDKMRAPQNFFKHADKDPGDELLWDTDSSFLDVLITATLAWRLGITSPQIELLLGFSMQQYPSLWKKDGILPNGLPIFPNGLPEPLPDHLLPKALRLIYETRFGKQ